MNMYVSNLSFQITEEDLYNLFAQYGKVYTSKIINDRETGKSRGFGFVDMSDDQEANAAMKELNGKEIEGRQLSVTVAREKETKSFKKW